MASGMWDTMTDEQRKKALDSIMSKPTNAGACSIDWMAKVGERIYGKRWMAAMSRALGVDYTTVQRWAPDHPRHSPISRAEYLHARHLLAMHEAGVPIETE
jgi:hypothetical protein